MISTAQAQETAIVASSPRRAKSCTPHLRDCRYYVHFKDFQDLCKDDAGDASALRGLEMMTNNRIREQHHFDDIPADHLPNEDDLWIEISGAGLSEWNVGIYSDRAYNYSLASLIEHGFLQRRFVAYPGRYMLEPLETTIYLDRLGNPFVIVDNDAGDFVDDSGEQQNAKDAGYTVVRRQYLYCIEKINEALAKLAGVAPPTPMPRWKSLQRVQRRGAAMETTNPTQCDADISAQISAAQGVSGDDESSDVLASKSELCVNKHNINRDTLSLEINENNQEIVELHNNSTVLLSAPWCAETLIALASHFLAVPDPAQCDEEQWQRDWMTPALWLIEHTDDLDCARAWVIIELHIAAMIAGPTWHAKKANKPFVSYGTLRHVVGWNKDTCELDGHNWKSTAQALEKERWADYVHIAYTGPSLFDESTQSEQSYAQGYGAQDSAQPTQSYAQVEEDSAQPLLNDDEHCLSTEHCVEVTAQSDECTDDQVLNDVSTASSEQSVSDEDGAQGEHCDQSMAVRDTEALEVIAQPEEPTQSEEPTQYYTGTELALQIIEGDEQGMTSLVAARLRTLIRKEYPDIVITTSKIDGYCLVAMQIALDTWYYFGSLADWNEQSPETQEAVEAADRYAQQRNAAQSNDGYGDSQGPPGDAQVSEEGGEWR